MTEDATTDLHTVGTWFSGIVGENPSWDLILILVVVLAVVLLAFLGRARLVALAVAAYMSIGLVAATSVLDWAFNATQGFSVLWTIVGSLAVATVLFYLLVQYGLSDLLQDDEGYFASSVILGIAVVGMLISYAFTLLPVDVVVSYSPLLVTVLTGTVAGVLWMLAPIIVIGVTRD